MIGIIGFANLRIMQYLKKYTDLLDVNNIEYEVVYWNREGTEKKDFKGNVVPFEYPINTYQPFYKKIGGFLKYSHFMYKTIKQRKYDKLVILTTQTAVPLFKLLLGIYKNKYILDYRDVTKEKILPYKALVKKLIRNSYCTAISSMGFKEIIGESDKYVMSHNCSNLKFEETEKRNSNKINIAFWGIVRHIDLNKRICDVFGNDERFNLYYHGDGFYKELKEYCNEKKYNNIYITGRYNRDEIKGFADNTDIINCVYDNDIVTKPTMPVKLYDAVRYKKPILVQKDSYVETYLKNYEIGFSFDIDNDVKEEIYNWFYSDKNKEITQNYQELLKDIINDDLVFEEKLLEFANE